MKSLALSVEKLTMIYSGSSKPALSQFNMEVRAGEIFGLLGPNGAGKTSLISILTTLIKATSGQALVFGKNVDTDPDSVKPLLGVVGQEIITSGFFDVEEILKFHSGYYGLRENSERIEYLLEKLSLKEHRKKKVKQLSGGMKRRLMIAKALVHNPKVLLLDEPTAGVDIGLRESLWEFVKELKQQGVTVLLTTHYLQEAEHLCDRVGIILNGEMKCVGDTAELIKGLSRRQIQVTLNNQRPLTHADLLSQQDGTCTFSSLASKQVGSILAEAGIRSEEILDLNIKEGGLEEAMKQILSGRGSL